MSRTQSSNNITVTVTTLDQNGSNSEMETIRLEKNMDIGTLNLLLKAQFNISNDIKIELYGKELSDLNKTLNDYKVTNNSMLVIKPKSHRNNIRQNNNTFVNTRNRMKQSVQENYEQALQYMPESFGSVVMLYVPMEINNKKINAFVDSGAQITIMSLNLAKSVGLDHLIDYRYKGIAKGVGTGTILGKIHMAYIKFGNQYFPCSFTIMDDPNLEFIFGLDMLRRHQANIDLKKNKLIIGNQQIDFLQEKDIPHLKYQNLQNAQLSRQRSLERLRFQQYFSNNNNNNNNDSINNNTTNDKNVEILIKQFGCRKDEAINALKRANGNVDLAASILFDMI